ncbi:hypothetical protein BDA96_04G228000 [Sorghum bicolor]|uniref:Uncharacterized protein n=1 Tax=Sorghum bicolor TaxID=4558 RepID=A0A921UJI8_SORBI|nr:hypothetical protein BDA96_04G228000 [Sorghum bicolor]
MCLRSMTCCRRPPSNPSEILPRIRCRFDKLADVLTVDSERSRITAARCTCRWLMGSGCTAARSPRLGRLGLQGEQFQSRCCTCKCSNRLPRLHILCSNNN